MLYFKTATLKLVIFIVKVFYTLKTVLVLLFSIMESTLKLWESQNPFYSFKSQIFSFVLVLYCKKLTDFVEIRLYFVNILLIDAFEVLFCEILTIFLIIFS